MALLTLPGKAQSSTNYSFSFKAVRSPQRCMHQRPPQCKRTYAKLLKGCLKPQHKSRSEIHVHVFIPNLVFFPSLCWIYMINFQYTDQFQANEIYSKNFPLAGIKGLVLMKSYSLVLHWIVSPPISEMQKRSGNFCPSRITSLSLNEKNSKKKVIWEQVVSDYILIICVTNNSTCFTVW